MDLEALKVEFFSYLEEKHAGLSGQQEPLLIDPDASIFQYSTEFKDFLVEEVGIDASVLSKDIFEIMQMEFEDGKLVEKDSAEEYASKDTDDLLVDILNEFMGDIELGENEDVYKMLNDIAAYDEDKDTISLDDIFAANEEMSAQKPSYNLEFLGDISKYELSENSTLAIGQLFDKDKDGIISEEEQQSATELLKSLKRDENDSSENGLNTLTEYISTLEEAGMSTNEIVDNIMSLDGNKDDLSENDFKALLNLLPSIQEAAEEGIVSNPSMEAAGAGSIPPGSKTPANPAMTQENIQNMSIEALEEELTVAQTNVKKTKSDLMAQLEVINEELAQNIKTAQTNIEAANTIVEEENNKITENTALFDEKQQNIDSANTSITNISTNIDTLKAQLNTPDCNKEEINAQISALEQQKAELEASIPILEKEKEELDAAIKDSKTKIDEQEEIIKKNNTDLEKYMAELNALSETSPELKSYNDAYNKAVEHLSEVEQILETRKADREKEEKSNRPDNSEAPKDYRNNGGLDKTNLPMSYTLDGKTYNCVGFAGYDTNGDGEIDFKPDSWEEVQRYFANGGVANIGKYGTMQCHNYSDMLGQFVLGDINSDFLHALYDETNVKGYGDLDTAGYMGSQGKYNPRRFAQCKSSDRSEERAIIENELQNGRPCLVSVPHANGSHWVTAVGISDDGDILIWDSYNGSMEKLGCSSNSDTTRLHRNMATGNGIMVYCQGYSYQYNTANLIDYWSYVGNSPEYVLANGYKKKK